MEDTNKNIIEYISKDSLGEVFEEIKERIVKKYDAKIENVEEKLKQTGSVKTVNGNKPDENGNIEIELSEQFGGSWSDLNNKPFYEDYENIIEKVILEETTVSLEPNDGISEVYLSEMIPLIPGKKYNVVWNGISYGCECIEIETDFEKIQLIGNTITIGGEDNNIPFTIASSEVAEAEGIGSFIISVDGSTSCTVKVAEINPFIKKLDNKFIDKENLFSSDYVIVWDGNKYNDNLENIRLEEKDSVHVRYYKISDEMFPKDFFDGAKVVFLNDDDERESFVVSKDNFEIITENNTEVAYTYKTPYGYESFMVVRKPYSAIIYDRVCTFSEGVWLAYNIDRKNGYEENLTISITINDDVLKASQIYLSQNKNTVHSWNSLEDRPFYGGKPVVKKITLSSSQEFNSLFLAPIQIGLNYTIILDGQTYIAQAVEQIVTDSPSYIRLEVDDIINIQYKPYNNDEYSIRFYNGEYPHTLEIYEGAEGFKQIPEYYLPDRILNNINNFTVNINENNDGLVADKTFDEILEAAMAGQIVSASYMGIIKLVLMDINSSEALFSGSISFEGEYDGVDQLTVFMFISSDNTIEYEEYISQIGDTQNLQTENKYIVGAINELLEDIDSNTLTSDDAVVLLAETGFVEPASNNGYVFTDKDNVIYTF